MAGIVAANRLELLQIADAVARDKSIDKQVVLTAMEEAMQRAAKAHYGTENDIKVDIDPKTGETHVSRYLHVVEMVENDKTEISLVDARKRNPDAQISDIIAETLPPVDFNRINAQNAKQVIVQKVRDAERERQYDEYKDRIGEVVHGVVKRSEFGSVVVDLGKAEGVVRRDEMIPRESFRAGDRIRAYIYDVRRETRGPQIFLSRSHPQFMVRLFAQEVPEIYDGVIEIRARTYRLHQFRRRRLLDLFDLADGGAAQARGAGDVLARGQRHGGRLGLGRLALGRRDGRILGGGLRGQLGHAGGDDLLLAQRQHAALEVGNAAAAQVVIDHPQLDVVQVAETGVFRDLERHPVLLADLVAVVAVDQHVFPQHQRVATAFHQDAALQRRVFSLGQRLDIAAQHVVNFDLHNCP